MRPSPLITARLIGSDTATALGITATGAAPLLQLCKLLAVASHPATPLDAYRGDTLCLRARSIGEAARLEINAKATGFVARRAVRTASPMRRTGSGVSRHPPDERRAHGGGAR
jgi:hypothetical protein